MHQTDAQLDCGSPLHFLVRVICYVGPDVVAGADRRTRILFGGNQLDTGRSYETHLYAECVGTHSQSFQEGFLQRTEFSDRIVDAWPDLIECYDGFVAKFQSHDLLVLPSVAEGECQLAEKSMADHIFGVHKEDTA